MRPSPSSSGWTNATMCGCGPMAVKALDSWASTSHSHGLLPAFGTFTTTRRSEPGSCAVKMVNREPVRNGRTSLSRARSTSASPR